MGISVNVIYLFSKSYCETIFEPADRTDYTTDYPVQSGLRSDQRVGEKSGVECGGNLHLKLAGKTSRKLPQGEKGKDGSAARREGGNFCHRRTLTSSPILLVDAERTNLSLPTGWVEIKRMMGTLCFPSCGTVLRDRLTGG